MAQRRRNSRSPDDVINRWRSSQLAKYSGLIDLVVEALVREMKGEMVGQDRRGE